MKKLLLGVVAVWAVGCTGGAVKTCRTKSDCPDYAECVDGLCAYDACGDGLPACGDGRACVDNVCMPSDGGSGGGTGGGTGGGGMGGGGGDGGTGGGGGGQPTSYCDAGLSCAGWQECSPTVGGGACIDAEYQVTWTAPDAGAAFNTATVLGALRVTKSDGGTVGLTQVPVTGAMGQGFSGSGGIFTGTLQLAAPDGDKTFVAGWQDGGPVQALTIHRDTTPPSFTVTPPVVPTYMNATGFVNADPSGIPAVKKDEVVTVRVTSTATDVNPASVALSVMAGLQAWDAGVGAPCGAAAFCRDYTLALGPQPMDAFALLVGASVTGADTVGNSGAGAEPNLMTVTRWKWARQVSTTEEIKASPAIGDAGVVFVATRGSSTGALFSVTPQGTLSSVATSGPIEASPAIGHNATGADVVFYLDQSNGLRAVGGNACGSGNAGNLGSVAVLNDGTATVRAAGVVWNGLAASIQAAGPANCVAIGASGVPGMSFPGNVITDGTAVWYPADTGAVQRTDTSLMTVSNLTGIAAGTIYGMALFGSKFAGGGGGAGVGRIFVANATDGSNVTGDNPLRHVSGVAVGRVSGSDVLFAVTQEAMPTSGSGLLKRFDATGTNPTAVTWPSGFTFNFPASSIPGGTTPVLGANGFVYAVANNGNVAAVDQSSMAVRWTRTLSGLSSPGQVLASATLDCNRDKPASATGVYYFATTGGWLVAYIVDSPGLDTTAPWPKYQHDARNTGNLAVSKGCP
ncbi:MAG: hypothetical protein AB1730_02225 [Myxococcota bacterium]